LHRTHGDNNGCLLPFLKILLYHCSQPTIFREIDCKLGSVFSKSGNEVIQKVSETNMGRRQRVQLKVPGLGP
jgi:hypothetical protein